MQTQQTKNRFSGPKSYRDFEETGPCAELFIAGLKLARVSAKLEFRHVSLNGKFSLTLFVYNLTIVCSKNSREMYPSGCF